MTPPGSETDDQGTGPGVVPPPVSQNELLTRAARLAGRTLSELAPDSMQAHTETSSLRHTKGLSGALIESLLGAHAGNRDAPDFPDLGIELKTLPVSTDGSVQEATYVCKVSFADIASETWPASRVYRKISKVLFVPIEHDRHLPLAARRIGAACLFLLEGPVAEQIQEDWELLAGQIASGGANSLTSHEGQILHVRPKARNSRDRALAPAPDGGSMWANPKGFYLRSAFTTAVLRSHGLAGRRASLDGGGHHC